MELEPEMLADIPFAEVLLNTVGFLFPYRMKSVVEVDDVVVALDALEDSDHALDTKGDRDARIQDGMGVVVVGDDAHEQTGVPVEFHETIRSQTLVANRTDCGKSVDQDEWVAGKRELYENPNLEFLPIL